MPYFNIGQTYGLGISHCGSVECDGYDTVYLDDDDVDTIVSLIRKKGTADIDELDLEHECPSAYLALDEAYSQMAYNTQEHYWLMEGYRNGYFEYDTDELIQYCEQNCGFKFEYDPADFTDDDGELDQDSLEEEKWEKFYEWLDDYIDGLKYSEVDDFIVNHLNGEVDLTGLDYEIEIPDEIVEMAENAG